MTEFMAYKLPTVPEEHLQNSNWSYAYMDFLASTSTAPTANNLQVCVYSFLSTLSLFTDCCLNRIL